MIVKNLWRRKIRTLLTVLGIAVGVAAVVAFSAFGEGMANGFERTFSSSSADLTVSQRDAMISFLSVVDESVGEEIRGLPGVDEVAGTVIGVLQFPEAPYFIVKGEEPRGFPMRHYRVVAGRALTGKKEIMLGTLTAKNFKKKVGETFKVNEVSFRIVGLYETGISFEDGGAVVSLADAQSAFDKRHQVSYYNIKVRDPRRLDALKKDVEALSDKITATRSGEATAQTETLDLYRSFGLYLGIFAVLVGGLGMMNTTLMSVLERTREIGVLRALGWRRRRVVGMIVGESLLLALGGGVAGILLGVGLTALTRLSPAVETLLQSAFTPVMFFQALVIALLLGAVGAIYPAWRAAQLAPVEAMRYESGAGGNLGPRTRALARLSGGSAVRNLWRRPTRTLVTVIGIGIGVGFVVALLAMTEGFKVTFSQIISAGQADLMGEQAKASDVSLSAIDERVADRMKLHPEVRSVSKVLLGMSTQPELAYFIVFGLDPNEEYIKHYRIREGRLFARPREIIIGRTAANGLKKTVGDSLRIAGSRFTIVGIYENGQVFEDTSGTMALREAQQVFGKTRKVSLLGVGLRDPARAEAVARELEAQFPEVVLSEASKATERMQDFQTTYAVLNALIALTVVVGGIVMMNAMLMSVFERTQEIGVLRALGWRRRRVLRMVLAESLALSLVSALAGIAIGVGLNYLFTLTPQFGALLQPAFPPLLFVQVFVLAVVLGALGGLYPAWRAANLRPIEALRYE